MHDPKFDARGEMRTPAPDMAYANLPGIVVSDYFGSQFCGVPIGTYDGQQNKGKKSSITWCSYLYNVAEAVATNNILNNGISLMLLPEFKAVEDQSYWSDWRQEMVHMYGIFKTDHDHYSHTLI